MIITTYILYLGISLFVTIFIAHTLFHYGRYFLIDIFREARLADAVNHVLFVGFYLVNIAYVVLALQTHERPFDAASMLEIISSKLGPVLLLLGLLHFMNLAVISCLRRKQANEPLEIVDFLDE